MGAHDGHRNRMRERIETGGMEPLQDHEVLEYILFHFVPLRNTNDIAHDLIDTFGSFAEVLNADADRLEEVPGMTRNAALFLSCLPDIFRRYAASAEKRRTRLSGKRTVRDYLAGQMFGCPVEQACVLALDAQDGVIRFERLVLGTGDSVNVSVRRIVDFAMRTHAAGLVLAHNHPSGNGQPSQHDFELTRSIDYILGNIGVRLLDHLIFTDGGVYSFEESGSLTAMRGGTEFRGDR